MNICKDMTQYELPENFTKEKFAYCIGWLGRDNLDFKTGSVPVGFLDNLYDICVSSQVEEFRSTRPCQICYPDMKSLREATFSDAGSEINAVHSNGSEYMLGSANVLIQGAEKCFISPDLIWHFVKKHSYLPPEEFISAVMSKKRETKEKGVEVN